MTEIKRASVGIDGNRDFNYRGGALYVRNSQRMPGEPTHEEIIRRGRAIFMSKRFALRFLTSENHHPDHREFPIHGRHSVFNTPGQKYHPDLIDLLSLADMVLEKGMNPHIISYSAIHAPLWDHHISMMCIHEIEIIDMWGWFWTHCLGRTALDYRVQGFKVNIVKDATMGIPGSEKDIEYMRLMLREAEVDYTTTAELGIAA